MANERPRMALARNRWTVSGFADALTVDHKTVERWITKGRTASTGSESGMVSRDPEEM